MMRYQHRHAKENTARRWGLEQICKKFSRRSFQVALHGLGLSWRIRGDYTVLPKVVCCRRLGCSGQLFRTPSQTVSAGIELSEGHPSHQNRQCPYLLVSEGCGYNNGIQISSCGRCYCERRNDFGADLMIIDRVDGISDA